MEEQSVRQKDQSKPNHITKLWGTLWSYSLFASVNLFTLRQKLCYEETIITKSNHWLFVELTFSQYGVRITVNNHGFTLAICYFLTYVQKCTLMHDKNFTNFTIYCCESRRIYNLNLFSLPNFTNFTKYFALCVVIYDTWQSGSVDFIKYAKNEDFAIFHQSTMMNFYLNWIMRMRIVIVNPS